VNDFIFSDRLEKELRFLLENPLRIPNVLCFFGKPAAGKTSFARFLCAQVAGETNYLDSVSHAADRSTAASVVQDLTVILRYRTLYPDDKVFEKAAILDEFHNFTATRQDYFKIIFDRVLSPSSMRSLIIICVNTCEKNPIETVLTPAIYSRCHKINFDVLPDEISEVTDKAISRMPGVNPELIRANLPDWREVKRAIQLYR